MTAVAQPREWPGKWADDALCATTHPDLFSGEIRESTTAAKRICAACPVRTKCLEHALRNREHHGVWGGLSARQRRTLLEKRRAS